MGWLYCSGWCGDKDYNPAEMEEQKHLQVGDSSVEESDNLQFPPVK